MIGSWPDRRDLQSLIPRLHFPMAHEHLLISATFGVSVVNARSDEQTPDLHDCLPMGEVTIHNGDSSAANQA